MLIGLVATAVLMTTACLRSTSFKCDTDTSCGVNGQCESSGYCSFPDPGCASGRVYSDSAGSNAGKCTEDIMIRTDSGVDAPRFDAPTGDDAGSGCPQDFVTVANAGAHVYKVITSVDTWNKQNQACRQQSNNRAYLMVPDNQAELTAIDGLTGVGAMYWLGIDDQLNEGIFVNLFPGQVQTFLPWDTGAGEPDNQGGQGGQDCVDSHPATHLIYTDACSSTFAAVCECNP
jgi:hypothetical protein